VCADQTNEREKSTVKSQDREGIETLTKNAPEMWKALATTPYTKQDAKRFEVINRNKQQGRKLQDMALRFQHAPHEDSFQFAN
jgi:hypothetical protein